MKGLKQEEGRYEKIFFGRADDGLHYSHGAKGHYQHNAKLTCDDVERAADLSAMDQRFLGRAFRCAEQDQRAEHVADVAVEGRKGL